MAEQVQQAKPAPAATANAQTATKPSQPAVSPAGMNPAMSMGNSWTGIFKKWWFWVIVAVIVIGLGLWIFWP